jgi:hypothetical protein
VVVAPSAAIDRLLAWLKWPVAVAGAFLVPGLLAALTETVRAIGRRPAPSYAFLAGALAFAILWRLALRRAAFGRFLMVLEHELTHALMAWATLHRVVSLRATVRQGGHVQIRGRGNWLITVAPYFFPTASVIAMLVLSWLPREYLVAGNLALGATVAYHLVSTFSETHRHQPDLQAAGWLFCILFLPPANLATLALLLDHAAGLHPLAHLARVPAASYALWSSLVAGLG